MGKESGEEPRFAGIAVANNGDMGVGRLLADGRSHRAAPPIEEVNRRPGSVAGAEESQVEGPVVGRV